MNVSFGFSIPGFDVGTLVKQGVDALQQKASDAVGKVTSQLVVPGMAPTDFAPPPPSELTSGKSPAASSLSPYVLYGGGALVAVGALLLWKRSRAKKA
jgi:hypothetical protein